MASVKVVFSFSAIATVLFFTSLSFPSILASTALMTNNIKVGNSPVGIGLNSNTNIAYVTNFGSEYVSVINGTTDRVISNITTGIGAWGVDVNSRTNMIYVSNIVSNSVFVINGSTNKVIAKIDVGNQPYQVAVNPITDKVYVSTWNYPNGGFFVINGSTNKVIAKDTNLNGSSYGIAINTNTNKIYVNNFNTEKGAPNTVSIIDGNTDKVMGTVVVGYGRANASSFPNALRVVPIAVNIPQNTIYAVFRKSVMFENESAPEIISVINGTTNRIIANKTITATALYGDSNRNLIYAASPAGSTQAYDNNTSTKFVSTLVIINSTSNQEIQRIVFSNTTSEIYGIAINPRDDTIYASNSGPDDNSISKITDRLTSSITTVPEFFSTSLSGYVIALSLTPVVFLSSIFKFLKRKML
jgi:YVTN family beta-propeller protein